MGDCTSAGHPTSSCHLRWINARSTKVSISQEVGSHQATRSIDHTELMRGVSAPPMVSNTPRRSTRVDIYLARSMPVRRSEYRIIRNCDRTSGANPEQERCIFSDAHHAQAAKPRTSPRGISQSATRETPFAGSPSSGGTPGKYSDWLVHEVLLAGDISPRFRDTVGLAMRENESIADCYGNPEDRLFSSPSESTRDMVGSGYSVRAKESSYGTLQAADDRERGRAFRLSRLRDLGHSAADRMAKSEKKWRVPRTTPRTTKSKKCSRTNAKTSTENAFSVCLLYVLYGIFSLLVVGALLYLVARVAMSATCMYRTSSATAARKGGLRGAELTNDEWFDIVSFT